MYNESTNVKLLKALDVTDLAGDKVMIDFETGNYYLLRGSAVDIWAAIQSETTIGEIKEKLLSEYEVEESVCLESIISFLTTMQDNKFVQLS